MANVRTLDRSGVDVTNAQLQSDVKDIGSRLGSVEAAVQGLRSNETRLEDMFVRIMESTQRTSEGLSRLDATVTAFMAHVDQRFVEYDRRSSELCELRHKEVNDRIGRVEQQIHITHRQVEDMGENSKVFYIRQLESQLSDKKSNESEHRKNRFELRKMWKTLLVGAVVSVVTAVIVDRVKNRPDPKLDRNIVALPAASR